MKTVALCSLVTLSLTTLSIRTEAASAPDGSHPVIHAVKDSSSTSTSSHSKNVTANATDAVHGTVRANYQDDSDANNHKPQGVAVTKLSAATAAASKRLGLDADAVSSWAVSLDTNIAANPATTPAEQKQNAALRKIYSRVNAHITRINNAVVKLSRARSRKEAAAQCQSIETIAQRIRDTINLLHRDLVDIEATKLIVAGDTKAGNALLVRGRRIVNEKAVITPLRNLIKRAHDEAQAFKD
ncbi:MAG: hypothetical protein FJ390_00570 [Verrucomicrobia bacterium]|nr:hypothetical protein [Verrucomicrobiota bacterium]